MSNINKILLTVVSCVFMISVASVSIVSIVTSNKKPAEPTTTATTTSVAVQVQGETDSVKPPVEDQKEQTSVSTTAAPPTTASTTVQQATTSAPAADSAVTGDLQTDILGLWKDSAGMSGYEFIEGGKFNWTYVDLAGFGVPFNGKTSGVYTLEGDTLTIKYSIYSATIKKTYRISVTENELSMYDLEENETSTYVRAVAE